jgi:uncharacterized protein involved in exopolysaccharide biosynthesis
LRAEIARDSAEPAKAESAQKSPDSPQLQQLKAQLRAVRQSIASAKAGQSRIEQQVRAYEAKIEASPVIEQDYKKVTRDHETALQFYNTLLAKRNESSMATALEHRQQGEQFRVMDAPNLPDSPTFPNRRIFAGGGFLAGLFLGLMITALLEYRDTSLRNERDVWAFTKLPTLAVISVVDDLAGTAGRKPGRFSFRSSKTIEGARG